MKCGTFPENDTLWLWSWLSHRLITAIWKQNRLFVVSLMPIKSVKFKQKKFRWIIVVMIWNDHTQTVSTLTKWQWCRAGGGGHMAGQSIKQQGDCWTLSVNVHTQITLRPHTRLFASVHLCIHTNDTTSSSIHSGEHLTSTTLSLARSHCIHEVHILSFF